MNDRDTYFTYSYGPSRKTQSHASTIILTLPSFTVSSYLSLRREGFSYLQLSLGIDGIDCG